MHIFTEDEQNETRQFYEQPTLLISQLSAVYFSCVLMDMTSDQSELAPPPPSLRPVQWGLHTSLQWQSGNSSPL